MRDTFVIVAGWGIGICVLWSLAMSFWPTRIILVGVINAVLYTFILMCWIVIFFRIVFALQNRFNAYYNRKIYEKELRKQKEKEKSPYDEYDRREEGTKEKNREEWRHECNEEANEQYQNEKIYEHKSEEEMYAEMLGLGKENINKESIKSAYRNKMREYHPDRVGAFNLGKEFKDLAEEKSKQINEAYAFLKKRFCA